MAIKLTQKDIDHISRLVATEVDHGLRRRDPAQYQNQVRGVVDTVLNRMASGQFPNTVTGVSNQHRQFSKIAGPKNLQPYGTVQNAPKAPSYVSEIVTEHLTNRMTGEGSSVGGGTHYANPHYSTKNNRVWIDRLDGPRFGVGKSIHHHGTTAGFRPVEAELVDTVSLPKLPPQRPGTALAAIEEMAPSASSELPEMAYAPTPPARPLPKLDVEKTLRENLPLPQLLKMRNVAEYANSAKKGVTKVADAFGSAGMGLVSNIQDRWEGFNAPTPPLKPRSHKPVMSEKEALLQLGAEVDPRTGEIAHQLPTRKPRVDLPRKTSVQTFGPAGMGMSAAQLPQLNAPTSPMRPDDLQQNVVEQARDKVKTSLPQVFNTVHDVRGQIDGLKERAGDRLRTDLSRAVYGPSGRDATLDDISAAGLIAGANGYLYRKVPKGEGINGGEYQQAGKLGSDDAQRLGVRDPQAGRGPNIRKRTTSSRVWDGDQNPQGIFKRDDKPKKSFLERLFGRD